MSDEQLKRLTTEDVDGFEDLLEDIATGHGTVEGVQKLLLTWGSRFIDEYRAFQRDLAAAQETIAAKDAEIAELQGVLDVLRSLTGYGAER